MKKILNKKDGSALMVAIVIMIVLMFLALALLLVSYTLFATANRQQNLSQSRELAQTISRQLTEEITVLPPEAGHESEYPVWKYLKENISIAANRNVVPAKWPYYEPGKYRHEKEDAYRYFKLDSLLLGGVDSKLKDGGNQLLDNTTVAMYWESDNTNPDINMDEAENGIILTVMVTCNDNNEETTVTTQYELSVDTENGNAWTWRKEYESS